MSLQWAAFGRMQRLECVLHPQARISVTRMSGVPTLGEPGWILRALCTECMHEPDAAAVRLDRVPDSGEVTS